MPVKTTVPEALRPYMFHGVDLAVNSSGTQANGDCPWCGKEGKFTVEVASGRWRCFSCNEGTSKDNSATSGGNSHTFLRLLWEYSARQKHVFVEGRLRALANERGLALETVAAWGVVPSLLLQENLVPGFGKEGRINQLCRYHLEQKDGKRRYVLWATPQHDAALYGLNPNLYDPKKDTIYLCEGPWDAMALWEALGSLKWSEDGPGSTLQRTSNRATSLLQDANVLAVPGCNTFKTSWLEIFAGKRVVLLFDSDHPCEVNGRDLGRSGWYGMQRAVGLLASAYQPPAELSYLSWGPDGYDSRLPSGYDVRDWLTQRDEPIAERVNGLFQKIEPVPAVWVKDVKRNRVCGSFGFEPRKCVSWKELNDQWRRALCWRGTLDDCLSVLLAVCLSTDQVGDQLFLQLIGEAGSAKTKLCEALLASGQCYALEKIKGFLSGWRGRDDNGEEEDFSLLARINHKTLITAEGDLLLSNPRFSEIMSEQRRIFDGSTSSSFKNRKEDRHYAGLRTPWIIAGTPALLNRADAHLGDRFLRVYIDKPTPEEREEILYRAAHAADRNTLHISNGEVEKTLSPEMRDAYKATGGYVDYLRANVQHLVAAVDNPEWAIRQCITLAKFTAFLRSRPDPNPNSEMVCSEEPTRLTQQFVRLAKNLAAVMGKKVVDEEVMRRVKKVARDTAKGLTLDLCRILYQHGAAGVECLVFANETGLDYKKRLDPVLIFLAKIGVAQTFKPTQNGLTSKQRWRMTPLLRQLYQDVMAGRSRVAGSERKES